MKYLLDTNICIYLLKKRSLPILERLHQVGRSAVAISVITAMELRFGAEKSEKPDSVHAKLDLFLTPMRVLAFEEESVLACARLRADLERKGRPIGDMDTLIAAQALTYDLTLVSNNLREFERVPGLKTENWV